MFHLLKTVDQIKSGEDSDTVYQNLLETRIFPFKRHTLKIQVKTTQNFRKNTFGEYTVKQNKLKL